MPTLNTMICLKTQMEMTTKSNMRTRLKNASLTAVARSMGRGPATVRSMMARFCSASPQYSSRTSSLLKWMIVFLIQVLNFYVDA